MNEEEQRGASNVPLLVNALGALVLTATNPSTFVSPGFTFDCEGWELAATAQCLSPGPWSGLQQQGVLLVSPSNSSAIQPLLSYDRYRKCHQQSTEIKQHEMGIIKALFIFVSSLHM